MNNEYVNGNITTEGDYIWLKSDTLNLPIYNYRDKVKANSKYIIYMPEEFCLPLTKPRKTRYLVHNNDLILTLA